MNIFSNEIYVPVFSFKAKTDAPGTYFPAMCPNIMAVRLWLFQRYVKLKKCQNINLYIVVKDQSVDLNTV